MGALSDRTGNHINTSHEATASTLLQGEFPSSKVRMGTYILVTVRTNEHIHDNSIQNWLRGACSSCCKEYPGPDSRI